MLPIVFAHGMEGSPRGTKARYLGAELGAVTPDLGALGLAGQVDELARTVEGFAARRAVVIGSSLGALGALGLAARRPELLSHLVLLAPAVRVAVPADRAAEIEHRRPGLVAEMAAFSELLVPPAIPATVIHGLADDVVDAHQVVELVRRSPSAQLLLVHDDHPLSGSRELILAAARRAAGGAAALFSR